MAAETRTPLGGLGPVLATFADRHPEEVLPGSVAHVTPRLLANRGVLRAVLAEASVGRGSPGRAVVGGLYASLIEYLQGQMAAGRLRQTDPLAAVQALIGPLLTYATLRPELWSEVVPAPPPPQETIAQLVQIWLRGMRPDPPTESTD